MTREEIIEQLNLAIGLIKQDGKDWLDERDIPILEECVKALSQEPCDEIDEIDFVQPHKKIPVTLDLTPCGDAISRPTFVKFEGTNMACMGGDEIMKEFENNTPQNNDDAISRKSIKQKLQENHDFFVNAYGGFSNLPQSDKTRVDEITNCIAMVVNEPSVNPQPKAGHWEWVQYDYNPKLGNWQCSECRSVVIECVNKEDKGGIPLYKYCPQCGARIVEPQESEEV